ncbi:MAG: hypothetical protein AAF394_18880 [Planctomycetota bacterium]
MTRIRICNTSLTLATALLSLFAGSALSQTHDSSQRRSPQPLQVGESISVEIRSGCPWNRTGIELEAGAHYQFQVSACDTWQDASIVCSAGGWTRNDVRPILRPLVKAAEKKRRMPSANWFELIGVQAGSSCQMFRIGCRGAGWTYSPTEDGEFVAFANDLKNKYGNNSGSLRLTVTRVAESGQPLPTR